jgi:hypothetical protein
MVAEAGSMVATAEFESEFNAMAKGSIGSPCGSKRSAFGSGAGLELCFDS